MPHFLVEGFKRLPGAALALAGAGAASLALFDESMVLLEEVENRKW